jgi:hypothetical protein
MPISSLSIMEGLTNLLDASTVQSMLGGLDMNYIDTLKDRINLDKLKVYSQQRQHRNKSFIKT